jgi:cytochrome c556
MKQHKMVLLAAALGLAFSAAVTAQNAFNDADKAVEYRQKAFSVMQNNFAAMGDMVRGDAPFDAAIFAARASDFSAMTSIPWPAFSTAGANPGANSDALPAIWSNWDDFNERADKLQADAKALAEVAATGVEADMRKAFMTAARNCKACHDQYKD